MNLFSTIFIFGLLGSCTHINSSLNNERSLAAAQKDADLTTDSFYETLVTTRWCSRDNKYSFVIKEVESEIENTFKFIKSIFLRIRGGWRYEDHTTFLIYRVKDIFYSLRPLPKDIEILFSEQDYGGILDVNKTPDKAFFSKDENYFLAKEVKIENESFIQTDLRGTKRSRKDSNVEILKCLHEEELLL